MTVKDGLIVKIQLIRSNGRVVVEVLGNAYRPVSWKSPPDGQVLADGHLLSEFHYIPTAKPVTEVRS